MYKIKILVFLIIVFFLRFENAFSLENKILVKVNNEIITSIDIVNEIKYLKTINPSINELNENQIIEISKNSLIREKIKKIKVENFFDEITLENKYFDVLVRNTYKQLGLKSIKEFETYLTNNEILFEKVKKKTAIDAYWNKIIYEKFSSKIKVNEKEIKLRILSNDNQKIDSYELYEILFNIPNKEKLDEKFKIIKNDIKKKGFKNAALIHSISDSGKNGGNLGFVNSKSINKKILREINKLQIGDYTRPIIIPGGFLILKLNNIKKSEEKVNIDSEIERLKILEMNKQLNQYSNLYFNKIKKDIVINEK